jgi:hypothetical protein
MADKKVYKRVLNPERKGFPGVLKFWLPKYIDVVTVEKDDGDKKEIHKK